MGGRWPSPMAVYISHISRAGICIAIFTVPTLLDFWITSANVSTPCGCASLMGAPAITMRPGEVSMRVLGVQGPRSSANAAVKGFIVEPGSKVSASALLRSSLVRAARMAASVR